MQENFNAQVYLAHEGGKILLLELLVVRKKLYTFEFCKQLHVMIIVPVTYHRSPRLISKRVIVDIRSMTE